MEISETTKSPLGGFTVLNLLTTGVLVAAASLMICGPHCDARGAQGVTASKLDLLSQKQLSVSGCGRLKLGAPKHWATS